LRLSHYFWCGAGRHRRQHARHDRPAPSGGRSAISPLTFPSRRSCWTTAWSGTWPAWGPSTPSMAPRPCGPSSSAATSPA